MKVVLDKQNDRATVKIEGVIDEDADFSAYSLAGLQQADIHLENLKSINSCGIREWIKWIGTASGPVSYHNCPKFIVDQINMVQGFLPANGKVMSFYVPYFNDETEAEKNVLFQFGKEYTDSGLGQLPVVKDEQGKDLELDVIESKYFKFLKKS